MARVIDRYRIIADDWRRYDRFAAQGAMRRVLVSSDDLVRYPHYFERSTFELGLDLGADEAPDDFVNWLPRLDMVRLNFESFADGRAFSQAQMLRHRYAFSGDIRAHGQVLRDQLSFMFRCGINQFSLAQGEDIELALAAFTDISESYQPDSSECAFDRVVNG